MTSRIKLDIAKVQRSLTTTHAKRQILVYDKEHTVMAQAEYITPEHEWWFGADHKFFGEVEVELDDIAGNAVSITIKSRLPKVRWPDW